MMADHSIDQQGTGAPVLKFPAEIASTGPSSNTLGLGRRQGTFPNEVERLDGRNADLRPL